MGHRANFVVIRDGHADAYFDQWAGLGCVFGFAAGPDDAVAMLSTYTATNELMDWAFAEGGFLIDFDRKTALVFGDMTNPADFLADEFEDDENTTRDEEFDPSVFLDEIAANWIGWKLIFDQRGVDAFAEYLTQHNLHTITAQPKSHPAEIEPAIERQA